MAEGRVGGAPGIGQLVVFFIPLSLSASMVALSQIIINGTLSRSQNAEQAIAAFAVALSVSILFDRPNGPLRQICSLLVRDRVSLRAMSRVTLYVMAGTVGLGMLLAFTPVGVRIFASLVGVPSDRLPAVIHTFRLLVFVPVFSCFRSHYQGLIIFNRRTKWLPIGMCARLAGMLALAAALVRTDRVTGGWVGAALFVAGMFLEAAVMMLAGNALAKKLPAKREGHPVERASQVFAVYRPLLLTSLIAVLIGPTINASLGRTESAELAIAALAIAYALTQFVTSFFFFTHQLVMQFYGTDRRAVRRFMARIALLPALLLGLLAFTPAGPWFMAHLMGLGENLRSASLQALRVYLLLALLFPWLEWCNGVLMLRGRTGYMVRSQAANLGITCLVLALGILYFPQRGEVVGAWAQSAGTAAELLTDLLLLGLAAGAKNWYRETFRSKKSPTT